MIDERGARRLVQLPPEMGREIRWAFRRLGRSPGFAAAAIVTLALGIGMSAAVLTLVNGILLKPLPYPAADRLVVIQHELPGFDMPGERVAKFGGHYALLAHYLERSRAFEEIGGFASFDAAVAEPDNPQFLRMASATAGFFRVLGLQPVAGRLFEDEDPAPDVNARGGSLLAHSLWSERYGRAGRATVANPTSVCGPRPPASAGPATSRRRGSDSSTRPGRRRQRTTS